MLDGLIRISQQELLDLEASETMVVTVNNRMAIHLKRLLISAKRETAQVFELPRIQPWSVFTESLTERVAFAVAAVPAAKQLSHFAALLYWEAVLEEQQLSTLNLSKLARVLAEAHTLETDWAIRVEDAELTPEYREYQSIKQHYLARLQQRDAIDGPLRDQWLLQQLQEGNAASALLSGKAIVLLGFRELSPTQSALLAACQALGASLYRLHDDNQLAAQLSVYQAHSRREELEAAVDWAKAQLAAHPTGRFAIIDPLLQSENSTVRRYLHERLQASGLQTDLLYNVAIGRPLSDWTIVRSALACLRLFITLESSGRIATQALGEALLLAQEALLSAWSDEIHAIDLTLREANKISYKKAEVQQFFYEISDEFVDLTKRAFALFGTVSSLKFNQHLAIFKAFFELFNFPGIAKLSSVQYQVCQAFDETLKNAAALSPLLDTMSIREALHLFERLCSQQIFQPQRAATARLDVLGMLEAEGAKWDAVWILSLQDDVLPTVPKPNPLIPKTALQRVAAPRSDQQREFEWAQAMLEQLLSTAPQIHISWHAFSGEMPTKVSPLLAQYLPEDQWLTIEGQCTVDAVSDKLVAAELEFLQDNYGPPVAGLLSGGTRLIDLQAKNPLWAFAVYRLHMREFHSYPRYELDRMQRGSFMHAALELFWQGVRDQHSLQAMDETELKAKISEVVDVCAKEELLFDSNALLNLEKEYAKNQLFHFLSLEQKRELSFSVQELEKKVQLPLASIQLRVTVDRIDYLENNSYLYLDYKTGSLPNYKKHWYRERPIDLQLPLYAAYGEHAISDIGGVGFASLKPGKMGFGGIGLVNWSLEESSKGVEQKTAAAFEELLRVWKTKLHSLAEEISNGFAANRYEDKKDMDYCEVLPFLRLSQSVEEEESDDE
ncbi:PD-(D/E)XK nuclease family protein [Oligella urethralis]|uniref:PD-(D/E)XK nuclease family protein n=1 Tax=Oligella urethralis TaxID=90245 RepID=UPI00288B7F68|nr:PD-(D/E)XK nuclease family protein [Oligella urethralis]